MNDITALSLFALVAIAIVGVLVALVACGIFWWSYGMDPWETYEWLFKDKLPAWAEDEEGESGDSY